MKTTWCTFFQTIRTGFIVLFLFFFAGSAWAFEEDWGESRKTTISRSRHAIGAIEDGNKLLSHFTLDVLSLSTPDPHEIWEIQSDIAYESQKASGSAYLYRADDHPVLKNPVIVVEGADIFNSMTWDDFYGLMNQENMLENLRNQGHDLVFLDFDDSTDYIQRNAFVLIRLIELINAEPSVDTPLVIVGISAGGLVARYALTYMEKNGLEHNARAFISFDTPHKGVNIPLGLQHCISFASSDSAEALEMVEMLEFPAARQLLVYHYLQTSDLQAAGDPLRGVFADELAAMGSYPADLRKVAIANGSGYGWGLPFNPGDQLIEYEFTDWIDSPFGAVWMEIAGNVWAVPDDIPETMIFEGKVLDAEDIINVAGTRPFDNAPGSTWNTNQRLADIDPPYGDISTEHPDHCLVPTISALDIDTPDLFYYIVGDGKIMDKTPFDEIYFPVKNQEHMSVTPENAEWLIREINFGNFSFAYYYPHIACTGSWETEICIINTSDTHTMSGVFRAYDNAGVPVSEIDVIALAPHGRREITVGDEFTDPADIGYIVFESNSSAIEGYTKFYIDKKYRVAIPAVSEINTGDIYISHIASTSSWGTGVSLLNTTSSPRTLTIEFDNGQTRTVELLANEHKAFLIKSLFGGAEQPDIYSAVIKGGSGVVGLELFSNGNQMSGILLKDTTTDSIYYPHTMTEDGWGTGIVAYNPSDTDCALIITPYTAAGVALAPAYDTIGGNEHYIGLASDLGLPLDTAWLKIDAVRPITGFELFAKTNLLGGYTGVGIAGTQGVFAKLETDGSTTIAFANIEGAAAAVTLTAYDDGGAVKATEIINLDVHENAVNPAEDIFAGDDISTATYITYSSDREIVGFQLNASADGMMLDVLPGM